MIRPTILEDTDTTGFETNTLKEAESVMVNSGRELKKTPLPGPYSVKETKENIRELYEERVLKPLEDEEEVPEDYVGEPVGEAPAQAAETNAEKKADDK